MNPWTALLLGLLGGVHCASMCGPLMLALPHPGGGPTGFAARRLVHQAGRLFTYCLLGITFGLLGQSVAVAGAQRAVSLALGVVLLLGLISARRTPVAGWVAQILNRLRSLMGAFLHRSSWGSHFVLGMLNGLLPCGLVYVACAGAATAENAWHGLGYMALFGAGTFPTVYAISLSGRLLSPGFRLRLRGLAPAGVALLGMLLILRGLALEIPYVSPGLAAGAPSCHTP